jgi:hypothetical protein
MFDRYYGVQPGRIFNGKQLSTKEQATQAIQLYSNGLKIIVHMNTEELHFSCWGYNKIIKLAL